MSACSRGSPHSRSTASTHARYGSRSTSTRDCPRSRSSGSATRPCGSPAIASARRFRTRGSCSRSSGSPPTSRPRSFARSGRASTPRSRLACSPRAIRCPPAALRAYAVFGELSLTGELRDTPGALAVAEGARRAGLRRLIVPRERAREAALVRRPRGRRGADAQGRRRRGDGRAAAAAARAADAAPARGRRTRPGRRARAPHAAAARSRSPLRARTTCCSRAPRVPARRCSPGDCPRSCRR